MDANISTASLGAEEQTVQTDGRPERNKRIERRWFWIALLSLVNLYYTLSAAGEFFNAATELHDYYQVIIGSGFVISALGVFLTPIIFKRLNILDNPRRYRLAFCVFAAVGIAAYIIYGVILGNGPEPGDILPALILQFVITLVPASATGVALHKAVKAIDGVSAARLSGLTVLIFTAAAIVHLLFISLSNDYFLMEVSFIVVYAVPLIITVILLFMKKPQFEYAAPKNVAVFSESLFSKFMILSFFLLMMDALSKDTYYAGGNYDSFSLPFQLAVTFMPVISAFIILLVLRRKHWFPVALGAVLAVCFQQGLILFFNDNETLAVVYAFLGFFSGGGIVISGLFIPFIFSVQRRKNVATGIMALWLLVCSIGYYTQPTWNSDAAFLTPAVTFTLSIAAIAYLFYLYGENNRVYIAALIEEFRDRDVSEVNEAVARTDRLENLGLTPREKEVCALLLKSLTVRQISGELSLAFNTVNSYYRSLYKKLGIGSKAELFLRFGQAENEVEAESVSGV
jgi:DNA-binding CsgD family transcriptional regulator